MQIAVAARRRDHRGHFIKKAIPAASRREVAIAAGGRPGQVTDVTCHYCGAPGRIWWTTPAWVSFEHLEMDHVEAEYMGGDSSPGNLVLACRPCNRRKGWRHA